MLKEIEVVPWLITQRKRCLTGTRVDSYVPTRLLDPRSSSTDLMTTSQVCLVDTSNN